jgi:hypothetical protein
MVYKCLKGLRIDLFDNALMSYVDSKINSYQDEWDIIY